MKEAEQCFPNKTEPNDALDLGDKNRKKKEEKLEIFDLFFFFLGKSHIEDDGCKVIQYFSPFCFRVLKWKFKELSGETIKFLYCLQNKFMTI